MYTPRKEIGSDFFLTDDMLNLARNYRSTSMLEVIFGPSCFLLSTCRSAIGLVLGELPSNRKKRAIVPGFTCHSVLSPFLKNGFDVYPYSLNLDLSVDWDSFSLLVDTIDPSVVLFHPYFGFNTLENGDAFMNMCQEKGITVIEDLTQCMFSAMDTNICDIHVGSIRKWFPIPDGAFLYPHAPIHLPEDYELAEFKIKAFLDKGSFLLRGGVEKTVFRAEFAQAEDILDSRDHPYRMAEISRNLFDSQDFNEFCFSRRQNYKVLADRFANHPDITVVFPNLPTDVVPFMFPVLVRKGRRELQQFMADHQVYPTVIWGCPETFIGLLSETVNLLFETILCFHCDQRYTVDDMNWVGDLLDSYCEGLSRL